MERDEKKAETISECLPPVPDIGLYMEGVWYVNNLNNLDDSCLNTGKASHNFVNHVIHGNLILTYSRYLDKQI